jgi:hypothetical protein
MASEKWSNPTVCLVPMSWPREYARHLDVRTTSIYPLPKMSPDRAFRTTVDSLRDESKGPGLFKVERVEKGFIADEEWVVCRPSTYR